jgi:hypothetical protein
MQPGIHSAATFGTVPPRSSYEPPDLTAAQAFDWSARLSLDVVRAHTKTNEIPTVTDEQLSLYRAVAIETAEKYTGLLLKGQRTITEPIEGPATPKPGRATYKHCLRYPVADGLVYLYGAIRHTFRVPPGSQTIHVPIQTGYLDLSNCCNPCSPGHHLNAGLMAAYLAGYASPDEVPDGVMHGCLLWVAWALQHPGDELVTATGNPKIVGGIQQGTNNIAMASGALEQWRLYNDSAI